MESDPFQTSKGTPIYVGKETLSLKNYFIKIHGEGKGTRLFNITMDWVMRINLDSESVIEELKILTGKATLNKSIEIFKKIKQENLH